MQVVAIIQARLGSTRLPGKVLLELLPGKTALQCMIERVRRAQSIDKIIIATTSNPSDTKLVEYLSALGIDYFVGSEDDVLDRYYQATQRFCQADDVIVRLTADCPLTDPATIDAVVAEYLHHQFDFVSNSLEPYSYPDGLDVEVFSVAVLQQVWRHAHLPSHREHVTFYIWQNPQQFKIHYYKSARDLSRYRLTLDYPEDYELIRAVYQHFSAAGNERFGLAEVIDFLDSHPDIKALNAAVKQNTGWQPALKKDQEFLKTQSKV